MSENIMLDALCYADQLESFVRHPLSSLVDRLQFGYSEEEDISEPSKKDYQNLQVNILKRQIEVMIEDEMKNSVVDGYHPKTTPSVDPTFSHSQTNLSEHYKQMMEKQEFIPFLSEKEKEEYLENIKKSEPLYYYSTCIHTELAKNFGEETLRKTNEYLQKQIKLLEREKSSILQEIENVNKKRKREQYDVKYELDKLTEKSIRTNHLIFKLGRECVELESFTKKLKQSREVATNESATPSSSDQ